MTGRPRDALNVPAGYHIRLHLRHPATYLIVAPEGAKATPEAALERGSIGLLLVQDEGVCWPDREGVAKGNAFLAQGWTVILQFVTLADALQCRTRLIQERVQ